MAALPWEINLSAVLFMPASDYLDRHLTKWIETVTVQLACFLTYLQRKQRIHQLCSLYLATLVFD